MSALRDRFTWLNLGLVMGFVGLILLKVKEYSVWDQIIELARTHVSIFHPHAARFAVMFPVIFIAQMLKVKPDIVFSYTIVVVMTALSYLIARILSITVCGNLVNVRRLFPLAFVPIVILSLVMNGRIALAMLGIMLIISGQVTLESGLTKSKWSYFATQIVGTFFASVSSGSIVIAFLSVVTYNLIGPLLLWPKIRRTDLRRLSVGIFASLLVIPFVLIGLKKNIDFYGGDDAALTHILKHGFGRFFPTVPELAIGLVLVIASFAVVLWVIFLSRLRRGGMESPLLIAVLLACMGGIFGVSTLVSCLPVVYLLILNKALRGSVRQATVVTA